MKNLKKGLYDQICDISFWDTLIIYYKSCVLLCYSEKIKDKR